MQSQLAVLRSPSSEQAAPPGLCLMLDQSLRGLTMQPISLRGWLWSKPGRMASSWVPVFMYGRTINFLGLPCTALLAQAHQSTN